LAAPPPCPADLDPWLPWRSEPPEFIEPVEHDVETRRFRLHLPRVRHSAIVAGHADPGHSFRRIPGHLGLSTPEADSLENCYTGKGIVGSNPRHLSAADARVAALLKRVVRIIEWLVLAFVVAIVASRRFGLRMDEDVERIAGGAGGALMFSWIALQFSRAWWPRRRFLRTRIRWAAAWSFVISTMLAGADVWIDLGSGGRADDALRRAALWWYLWPAFFLALWVCWPHRDPSHTYAPEDPLLYLVDLLPGARESGPAVAYALAIPVAVASGVLTLALIGEERFLGREVVMIGGFLGGAAAGLLL
jgi:hypothetical protein